ncbi:MAG: hypothetical protein HQ558_05730 [Candidatus Omnitrophica bacterium]|nr:hypothetical protein [Candidatus Omnitrophota bacterium]
MIKKITQRLIAVIQKILITVFLTLLYIFGFGIMFLLAAIFNRRLLRQGPASEGTLWSESQADTVDIETSMRQS